MPIRTLIRASEPEQPDVRVEEAHVLLGDWTWEPATSRPVGGIEEGPLGSVDLSLRGVHDRPAPSHTGSVRL